MSYKFWRADHVTARFNELLARVVAEEAMLPAGHKVEAMFRALPGDEFAEFLALQVLKEHNDANRDYLNELVAAKQ